MTLRPLPGMLIAAAILICGCEYAFSDAATRIRYALLDARTSMMASGNETKTITVSPDHWPGGCGNASGFTVVFSPYDGGKQVPVGDIDVHCNDGQTYYTGFGSEQIYVPREIDVDKKSGEAVQITLRKTSSGFEIIGLE